MNEFYSIMRDEDYKPFVESKGNGKFSADYVSWAVMHDMMKKHFSYVEYIVHEYNIITSTGATLTLPYMVLPNGSAMVKVTLKVTDKDGDSHEHSECLAVRDFKMQAQGSPDSAQVENTIRRCIAKAGSMLTGFGIELWFGEDIKGLDYKPSIDDPELQGNTLAKRTKESIGGWYEPTKGHITVDQWIKIQRLMSDAVFNDQNPAKSEKIKVIVLGNPTEEVANQMITKLQKQKKELKTKAKEKKVA